MNYIRRIDSIISKIEKEEKEKCESVYEAVKHLHGVESTEYDRVTKEVKDKVLNEVKGVIRVDISQSKWQNFGFFFKVYFNDGSEYMFVINEGIREQTLIFYVSYYRFEYKRDKAIRSNNKLEKLLEMSKKYKYEKIIDKLVKSMEKDDIYVSFRYSDITKLTYEIWDSEPNSYRDSIIGDITLEEDGEYDNVMKSLNALLKSNKSVKETVKNKDFYYKEENITWKEYRL